VLAVVPAKRQCWFNLILIRSGSTFFLFLSYILTDRRYGRLTADRLLLREWPNNYFRALCERNLETAQHLFLECPVAIELWHKGGGLVQQCGVASGELEHYQFGDRLVL
jgi:hypothetical protein